MSDNPVVTLAGKSYPVPPLVPRQLRVVIPALMRLRALISKEKGGEGSLITTALYDDMLIVLFWGVIWVNDRKLSQEAGLGQLMDTALSFNEMMKAMDVIREQTGLFQNAPAEGAPSGEVSPASTGTPS